MTKMLVAGTAAAFKMSRALLFTLSTVLLTLEAFILSLHLTEQMEVGLVSSELSQCC